MTTIKRYENFPAAAVLLSNLNSLIIYGSGFLILSRTGLVFALLYLVYILAMEYRLLKYHCINCYYYGKTCGFGKGRISALFFKKGDAAKFCIKEMSWKDMIPDIMVSLIPLVTGIILLIVNFNLVVLAAILLLVFCTTTGNSFIRGSLTCKFCRQREMGCPADALFNKR